MGVDISGTGLADPQPGPAELPFELSSHGFLRGFRSSAKPDRLKSPEIVPLERFPLRDGSKSPLRGEVNLVHAASHIHKHMRHPGDVLPEPSGRASGHIMAGRSVSTAIAVNPPIENGQVANVAEMFSKHCIDLARPADQEMRGAV